MNLFKRMNMNTLINNVTRRLLTLSKKTFPALAVTAVTSLVVIENLIA